MRRPHWLSWPPEFTTHVLNRMDQRGLSELDVSAMLDKATPARRDLARGRWILRARHLQKRWEIVVEPDPDEHLLVIITLYAQD